MDRATYIYRHTQASAGEGWETLTMAKWAGLDGSKVIPMEEMVAAILDLILSCTNVTPIRALTSFQVHSFS